MTDIDGDGCADFDTTLRNMLATPPTPHKTPSAITDGDDLDEPQEQGKAGEESGE